MKIFSDTKSQAFWHIISNMKNETESEIMYCYGLKAQKLESSHDALVEACKLGILTMVEQHKTLITITEAMTAGNTLAQKVGIKAIIIPLPPIDILQKAIANAKEIK